MNKGYVSIIVSLAVVLIGGIIMMDYGNQLKEQMETFGGTRVSQKYGGTGTSTASWSGLLRLTGGTWATTTLVDADVPDDITVTNIPNELFFASTTHGFLAATNTVDFVLALTTMGSTTIQNTLHVNGTSSFDGIMELINATPTLQYQAASKAYVDEENDVFGTWATTTTAPTNIQASTNLFISAVCDLTGAGSLSCTVGATTTDMWDVVKENADAAMDMSGAFIVPKGYYYTCSCSETLKLTTTILD